MDRNAWEKAPPKDGPATNAADWDRQFAAGAWAYLHKLDELAHHSVIAGYIAHLGRSRPFSVLDVACGEGSLCRLLPRGTRYLGTDWSAIALEHARRLDGDDKHFIVADAEHYVPEQAFDVIVFNECLYYFKSACGTLNHYADYLAPDGYLIVSMYVSEGNRGIWRDIQTRFTVLDRTRVSNARRTAWQIAVLKPGIAPDADKPLD